MARKLFIQTHGCQMNEYDSTRMVDLLEVHTIPARFRSQPSHIIRRIDGLAQKRIVEADDVGMGHRHHKRRDVAQGRSVALTPANKAVVSPYANEQSILRRIREALHSGPGYVEEIDCFDFHVAKRAPALIPPNSPRPPRRRQLSQGTAASRVQHVA